MTKDCRSLGKFELTGIPPAPRGVPQIEVAFDVDANGILSVSARDTASGASKDITITAEKGRLSEDEIERMVREAEEFADEDAKLRENVEARNQFEAYAYQMRSSKDSLTLDADDAAALDKALDAATAWLDDHTSPAPPKDESDAQRKQLEEVANPSSRRRTSHPNNRRGRAAATCPRLDDFRRRRSPAPTHLLGVRRSWIFLRTPPTMSRPCAMPTTWSYNGHVTGIDGRRRP